MCVEIYMCVGRNLMLAIALMLVLAVNGGLFTGTILFSAYKTAKFDQLLGFAQKFWDMPFIS